VATETDISRLLITIYSCCSVS